MLMSGKTILAEAVMSTSINSDVATYLAEAEVIAPALAAAVHKVGNNTLSKGFLRTDKRPSGCLVVLADKRGQLRFAGA